MGCTGVSLTLPVGFSQLEQVLLPPPRVTEPVYRGAGVPCSASEEVLGYFNVIGLVAEVIRETHEPLSHKQMRGCQR